MRNDGILDWLELRNIKQQNFFIPGDQWTYPVWANKSDICKDFMRFLKTFIKRLFVVNSENIYRDPIAEKLIFTIRIYSEDKDFWQKWSSELMNLIYLHFNEFSSTSTDPSALEYYYIKEWSEKQNLYWRTSDILKATSIIGKIRGQLRSLRFTKYDLNEFNMKHIRFTVPTEMRGDILSSWKEVISKKNNLDILFHLWKISTLELVDEGRNAPLYRCNQIKKYLNDIDLLDYLSSLETYFSGCDFINNDSRISIIVQSDWFQDEIVDIFTNGTFWRIASSDKENINSQQLLHLSIVAGMAQINGLDVHSIGFIYPLDGRCLSIHLPYNWRESVLKIINFTKKVD